MYAPPARFHLLPFLLHPRKAQRKATVNAVLTVATRILGGIHPGVKRPNRTSDSVRKRISDFGEGVGGRVRLFLTMRELTLELCTVRRGFLLPASEKATTRFGGPTQP
jgi:hypothetical protein